MPLVTKSRIIVLHLTKYSDSSSIVHTIDSESGRKSYLVRGLKSRRNTSAQLHSLALLEAVGGSSPKSSLSYLKEWTPICQLDAIRCDMAKSAIAMFISEILYRSLTNELADEALFDWLCDSIVRLDAQEGNVANFHLWWLVSYCVKMGFRPSETIEPAGMFTPEEESLLRAVLTSSMEDTLALPLSSNKRRNFCRKMLQYLSYHLGSEINARSLDVLHNIFTA